MSRSWRHPIFEGIVIWASETLASSQVQPAQAMATFAANNSCFKPTTVKQMPNDFTLQTAATANWRHVSWPSEHIGSLLKPGHAA